MSREHVWSDWLKSIIPRTQNHVQTTWMVVKDYHKNEAIILPKLPVKRQNSLQSQTIRNVCKVCNNGWMSRIVNSAQTAAYAMIQDESIVIDLNDQIALASWISLSTIMAEFTDPQFAAISSEQRQAFYKSKVPPSNFTVCIGRYRGIDWSGHRYRHHGGLCLESIQDPATIIDSTIANTQVSFHILNSLLVIVFSSTLADIASIAHDFIPSGMTRIWPFPKPVLDWPAHDYIGDTALNALAFSFESYLCRGRLIMEIQGFVFMERMPL